VGQLRKHPEFIVVVAQQLIVFKPSFVAAFFGACLVCSSASHFALRVGDIGELFHRS
jgi:hypothetical protein